MAPEAAKTRIAASFRELGQPWNLAVALENLATALDQAGAHDDARGRWSEALSLLAEFDDRKAVEKRAQITHLREGRSA
jgi:hypothetical protein